MWFNITFSILNCIKKQSGNCCSNAQLLLLNLFEHDLSETDLESLRRSLVKFLNSKLQDELNSVIKTKKMTPKDINFYEVETIEQNTWLKLELNNEVCNWYE